MKIYEYHKLYEVFVGDLIWIFELFLLYFSILACCH